MLAQGSQFVTITGDVQRNLDLVDLLSRGYQILTRNIHLYFWYGGGRYHQYTQFSGHLPTFVMNCGFNFTPQV